MKPNITGKIKPRDFHPVADAFPPPTEEELQGLFEDIKRNGVRVPIVLSADGRIVDGRCRYNICADLGIEPPTMTLPPEVTPEVASVSYNLHRRNLTAAQRMAIAVRLLPHFEASARRRMKAGKPSSEPKGLARKQVAQAVRVAEDYVRLGVRIQSKSPELIDQMLLGKMSVRRAADKIGLSVKRGDPMGKVPTGSAPSVSTSADKDLAPKIVQTAQVEDRARARTDELGTELPDNLIPAWEQSGRFDHIARLFREATQSAEQLASEVVGRWIETDALRRAGVTAAKIVAGSKPYCVCPRCNGPGCDECLGTGFLTKAARKQWDQYH